MEEGMHRKGKHLFVRLILRRLKVVAQLGLRRSFSAADVCQVHNPPPPRRFCGIPVGGSQLPSPQRAHPSHLTPRPQPSDNKKVRQNYIKKRLLTTYRALERMSQSEFNLDRLEQAAAASAAGRNTGNSLVAPTARPNTRLLHPETAHLVLTAADLERERGRPLSKYERNMMIFNWLHTLDEGAPF
ncbi:hypothetical protein RR48_01933 [Papilio machaon]|uniref:Uncharacterized protein n=1 Tax=Papilio machaon TaxID=76193 RepID=A0A0N1PGV2_PAPMA|nr:hypothetical protein RR48_01933 [Papilio machaon]